MLLESTACAGILRGMGDVNPSFAFSTFLPRFLQCPRSHSYPPYRISACTPYPEAAPIPALTTDQLSLARDAISVNRALLSNSVSTPSSQQLLAFLYVKSIPTPNNLFDQAALLSAARSYIDEERASRLQGNAWEELPVKSKITKLHHVCNAEGDVTYIDPDTGYTVFSFYAHLKRGYCCGIKRDGDNIGERIHRCRHCPYTDTGKLTSKMNTLKSKIGLIDYVREHANDINVVPQPQTAVKDVKEEPEVTSNVQLSMQSMLGPSRRYVAPQVKVDNPNCKNCNDTKVTQCTRCSGWTFLISPILQSCPQCSGNGFHGCMSCTSFRPPARHSFYS